MAVGGIWGRGGVGFGLGGMGRGVGKEVDGWVEGWMADWLADWLGKGYVEFELGFARLQMHLRGFLYCAVEEIAFCVYEDIDLPGVRVHTVHNIMELVEARSHA